MTRSQTTFASAALIAACVAASGCQQGGGFFLTNVLTGARPIPIALVTTKALQIDPFSPYAPLRKAMSDDTGRPVGLHLCFPIQLELNLAAGFYHFAIVRPGVYAALSQPERFPVVAVAADAQGRVDRPALLIAKAGSDLTETSQLTDKTVAFGPESDGRTHLAALDLLGSKGVSRDSLKKELLPIPGSLKHLQDGPSVAVAVAKGQADAGFIDLADWERIGIRQDDQTPPRDAFTVIDKTHPLPDAMIIASPTTDPAEVELVRAFLLSASSAHADTLEPLKISGYHAVEETAVAGWLEHIRKK